jgi:hypothetical protein
MGDIKSPRVIIVKGFLFLLLGLMAVAVVLLEAFTWRIVVGLSLAIWAFCRFYYFAFYVVEHYIEPSFKFAGLGSVVQYLWRRRKG